MVSGMSSELVHDEDPIFDHQLPRRVRRKSSISIDTVRFVRLRHEQAPS